MRRGRVFRYPSNDDTDWGPDIRSVIQVTDEDAMVRYFRRLASYRGRQSLRGQVKKDRSWFRATASRTGAPT